MKNEFVMYTDIKSLQDPNIPTLCKYDMSMEENYLNSIIFYF